MLLGVIAVSNSMTAMMALWVCICVKMYQLYTVTYYVYYRSVIAQRFFFKQLSKIKGLGRINYRIIWSHQIVLQKEDHLLSNSG